MSVNIVHLIGRLGKDPELRYSSSNDKVCNFSIAIGEKFKGKDGALKEKTEWVNIVCWRQLAETCSQHLFKGSQVFIAGKIRTRKWTDKNNQDQYSTEIIASDVRFLDPKKSNNENKVDTTNYAGSITTDDLPF